MMVVVNHGFIPDIQFIWDKAMIYHKQFVSCTVCLM